MVSIVSFILILFIAKSSYSRHDRLHGNSQICSQNLLNSEDRLVVLWLWTSCLTRTHQKLLMSIDEPVVVIHICVIFFEVVDPSYHHHPLILVQLPILVIEHS